MARPADPNARKALVASARAHFREHGIQRARIEDITAACGLSKGAFYLHYESKEALFAELVAEFERRMDELFERRTKEEDAFFSRGGPFRSKDFADGNERVFALNELQMRHDITALEFMWSMRDVIHVLMNGCQGTAFDGIFWQAIDREHLRVVQAAERLERFGVIRSDLSSEVVAMVLMGVWILNIRKMVTMAERPDFAAMLAELNVLVGEGLVPRAPPTPARPRTRRATPLRRTPRRASMRKAP